MSPPDPPAVGESRAPELPGLAAAVLAAAAGDPLESTLDAIVTAAVERVGATYGALGILTPDGTALDRFVIAGMDDATRSRIEQLPLGHGILGLLVADPSVLRLDDLGDHDSAIGFPPGHPPMRSFLGVPVRVRDAVFGNLYLTEKRAGGSFTAEDVEVAQALAAAAGLAIENARLAERAERRRRWGQAGSEVATALLSGTDPEQVLRLVTARVAELTDADLCGVLVPTEGDESSLTIITALGGPSLDVEGVRIPLTGSHVGRAYREGVPMLIEDLSADPVDGPHAEAPLEIAAEYGSALLAPLGGRPSIGVFVIGRRHGRRPYDGETLDLLSGLTAQVTVVLELARSQQRERRLQVQADRDRIARDLHDHVVQRVFAVALQLDRLGRGLRDERPDIAERLARSVDELDTTMAEIRSSIFQLHEPPDDVARVGVRAQLAEVVRQVTEGASVRPDVRTDAAVEELPRDLVADVVAVVRELVTNVVKHADARRVTVSASVTDDRLCLAVTDDGRGLPSVAVRSGLANLADRAERHHGQLTTRSASTGTEVRWSVPVG